MNTNEIGQLVDKKLHSIQPMAADTKQSVDYRYNIREAHLDEQFSITTDATNDDGNDYFGMNLLYEQTDSNLAAAHL